MSNEVLRSHGQIDTEPGLKFQQARFWSRVSSLHLRCCHVHCVCLPGNQAQSITCPSSSYVITWRVGRAICFRSSIFESIRPWVGREQKDYDIAIWHLQHSRHLLKQKYVVNDADFRRPPLSSVPGGGSRGRDIMRRVWDPLKEDDFSPELFLSFYFLKH